MENMLGEDKAACTKRKVEEGCSATAEPPLRSVWRSERGMWCVASGRVRRGRAAR
ncbi:peptidoglycan-binding protein LysM [Sesbania bispinosa]|nr:peptidoglycan-binding protein LysM [Sesbania bispinosa]